MRATAIDLFSGAGGLSLGLEAAGFDTVFAVDNDPNACSTYRAAFPNARLHEGGIRLVDFSEFRGVDLIAGGPPCQPFSTGGRRKGKDDSRDALPEFVRAVREARPKAFLLENVPGLMSPTHRTYVLEILGPLFDIYKVEAPRILDAADYGVPQSRRRMLAVGVLEGSFKMPKGDRANRRRSGDYLSWAPKGEPNASKIVYAKTPDLRASPYHGQLFNGGGRPVDLDAPAPTILASAGGNKTHFLDLGGHVPPYHEHLLRGGRPRVGELPDGRRLTVAECATLQTFPEGMRFCGPKSAQYSQVGNAVPPLLAATIGEAILTSIARFTQSNRAH
jgi:DNA (cytosine-5)-methyltransferase 1